MKRNEILDAAQKSIRRFPSMQMRVSKLCKITKNHDYGQFWVAWRSQIIDLDLLLWKFWWTGIESTGRNSYTDEFELQNLP